MQPLFSLPELNEEELNEVQPIEFAYPKDIGGPIKGLPGTDLTDVLRTNVGNSLGPLPKSQLEALTPSQLRALKNKRFEAAAGWAKPLAQFYNALTSPAVGEGMTIGVPNALLKLGNAAMDWFATETFGAPLDNQPAWQIPQAPLKEINPLREGDVQDTPADPYGYELGAEVAGEVAGAATGSTLLRRVPQVAALTNRVRQTQAVRQLAVKAATNKNVRRGVNIARWGGEAMFDTSVAALYQDADFGNVFNTFGDENPLAAKEGNSYFDNLQNKVIADGIFLPLTLIGAGQLLPWTRRLADGDLAWNLDELAQVELEPYVPRQITQPLLPPATREFDSAIDRSTSANLQVRQVQDQRARVNAMFPGLKTFEGGQGQFQLDLTGAGAAFREDGTPLPTFPSPDGGVEIGGPNFTMPERVVQPKLDLGTFGDAPDPRPEISTYLAELDELGDAQLKELLPKVDADEQLLARQRRIEEAQARVDAAQQKIDEIQQRLALPERSKRRLTEQGSKRLLNKAQAELDAAQLQVSNVSADPLPPQSVGEQLALGLQQSLDLAPESGIELPPIGEYSWDEAAGLWRPAKGEGGYPSLGAYREEISGWNRDLLRGMASPENSPEVAAILKARTGRRVWNAKKGDIVDALVEYASRRNRYAEPTPEQLPLEGLQQNLNLETPAAFNRRGLTDAQREEIKQKILKAALDNGEVQPDVTPIPDALPGTDFNQGQFLDALFEDEQFLLPFARDEVPTYKAAGKNADTLIEEVRQRFGWAELDGAAKRASDQALFERNGWNEMPWEQKKKMFAESRGLYRGDAGEVTEVAMPGETLEWTPEGNISADDAAAVRSEVKATKKKRPRKTSSLVKKARETEAKAEAKVAALKKQLERATCDG